MDLHHVPAMTQSFSAFPSRRDVVRGLACAGLGLAVPHLPDAAAAKKHHKHKNKKRKKHRGQCKPCFGTCRGGRCACSTGSTVTFDFLGSWSGPGNSNGQLRNPSDVAAAPDGTIYVADTGNFRIQRFTATGAFLTKWGGPGSGDGEFAAPFGVAVHPSCAVYVSDLNSHLVQVFRPVG
jgi:hypothetical protein